MIEIEESVDIHLPVSTVFDFTTNVRNNVSWQSGIVEIAITSEAIRGKGASFRCVNLFLGMRMETDFLVETYQPNKKCVYRAMNRHLTGRNTFIYREIEGGTEFTTQGRIDLGRMQLGSFILRPMVRSQVKNDLQNLKRILENGHFSR